MTPNDLAEIIVSLAPELAGVDVADAADFPTIPTSCYHGFATDTHNPLGDAPLLLLNWEAIEQDSLPGRLSACLLSVAIHEAAHVLPRRPPLEWPTAGVIRELLPEFKTHLLAKSLLSPQDFSIPCPGHDSTFLRRGLHLHGRAIQAGFDVPLQQFVGPVGNGWLSPEEDYARILCGEVQELRSATFAEIAAVEPPEEFTKLWQDDLVRFEQREKARCLYLKQRAERLQKC